MVVLVPPAVIIGCAILAYLIVVLLHVLRWFLQAIWQGLTALFAAIWGLFRRWHRWREGRRPGPPVAESELLLPEADGPRGSMTGGSTSEGDTWEPGRALDYVRGVHPRSNPNRRR